MFLPWPTLLLVFLWPPLLCFHYFASHNASVYTVPLRMRILSFLKLFTSTRGGAGRETCSSSWLCDRNFDHYYFLWPTLLFFHCFASVRVYCNASVYTVPMRMRGASTFALQCITTLYIYVKWSEYETCSSSWSCDRNLNLRHTNAFFLFLREKHKKGFNIICWWV